MSSNIHFSSRSLFAIAVLIVACSTTFLVSAAPLWEVTARDVGKMFSCINNTHFYGTPDGVPMMCAPGTQCDWVPGQNYSPCISDESVEAITGQQIPDTPTTPPATPSLNVTDSTLEETADASSPTAPAVLVSPGAEESEKEDTNRTNGTASANPSGPTATPENTTDSPAAGVEELEEPEEEESETSAQGTLPSSQDVPNATIDPSSTITPAPSLMNALVDKAAVKSASLAVSTLSAIPPANETEGTLSGQTLHDPGKASINPQKPDYVTACNTTFSESANSEPYYVAIEEKYFKAPGYPDPICGKEILLTWKGKSTRLKVSDKCPGCAGQDSLDISPAGFNAIFRPEISSPSDPNWKEGEIFGPNVETIANRGPMTWQFIN